MTEQEVQMFAERLCRIWKVERKELIFKPETDSFNGHLGGSLRRQRGGLISLLGLHRKKPVRFDCSFCAEGTSQVPYSVAISPLDGRGDGALYYNQEAIYDHYQGWRVDEEFVQEWLPFFRRGCWLSGCPIEATAHEKAEWMQGFSREELEAWNLKM